MHINMLTCCATFKCHMQATLPCSTHTSRPIPAHGPTFMASSCNSGGTAWPASASDCTSALAKCVSLGSSKLKACPSLSPARPVRPTLWGEPSTN
eukprot:scaffold54915_cov20-Tisochrysis_lutea.AAC.1